MERRSTSLIYVNITPEHKGECRCSEFLQPVRSWKDIAQRHDDNEKHWFSKSFKQISDASEDYTVDLYQCTDCGRYWAREDCGSPFATRSYSFYYFVDTATPGEWLGDARYQSVLSGIKSDPENYDTLIAPHLPIK